MSNTISKLEWCLHDLFCHPTKLDSSGPPLLSTTGRQGKLHTISYSNLWNLPKQIELHSTVSWYWKSDPNSPLGPTHGGHTFWILIEESGALDDGGTRWDRERGMATFQWWLNISRRPWWHQIRHSKIPGQNGERDLSCYLQHWLGWGQVSPLFVGYECQYVLQLAIPNWLWHFQKDSWASSRAAWLPSAQYIGHRNQEPDPRDPRESDSTATKLLPVHHFWQTHNLYHIMGVRNEVTDLCGFHQLCQLYSEFHCEVQFSN